MKIGIFDSGVGGLLLTRSFVRKLPQYNYIYLGDTKRVPYGNRSSETVYEFTREAVEYLFARGCSLIILACNTASAEALRRIQRELLPKKYPGRKVLGVIIPTAEAAVLSGAKRIGILATQGTVNSRSFVREIQKLDPAARVKQNAAPLLVPFIENGEMHLIGPILKKYLNPFMRTKMDTLVLGCTHYPAIKTKIRKLLGSKVRVISQDEIVPRELKNYLLRHPEIEKKLSKKRRREFLVTDLTDQIQKLARRWFGGKADLRQVEISN